MSKHSPYPYLRVNCVIQRRVFDILGYVDTGYEGGVIIPEAEGFGLLDSAEQVPIQLADGTLHFEVQYHGVLSFDGLEIPVSVLFLGKEYLIGREVVDQLHLCFHRGEYLEIE